MRCQQAVAEQHDEGGVESRQCEENEHGIHQSHPHEQRQPPDGHARCAHGDDRYDEIDG